MQDLNALSLPDLFDALTSRRPYKKPFSVEKSLDIIAEGSGQHFDPRVCEAFLAKTDAILQMKAEYADADDPGETA